MDTVNNFDLSLYLVTDHSLNHPSRTLLETIEHAILGGATIVQLREKELSTPAFVSLAKEVHSITRKHNVPLIINDNIEVVLESGAEGLHIGQDDMPCSVARQRLGPNKIIGVSVETKAHAIKALSDGANYIGIQTCYPTKTKPPTKPCLGHIGVREILEALPDGSESKLKTVAIGGINETNVQRLVGCSIGANGRALDGIAVVSEIVGAVDAKKVSTKLLTEFKKGQEGYNVEMMKSPKTSVEEVLKSIPKNLADLRSTCPLTHHITNFVVMNETANSTLALGGSPIMSSDPAEGEDLSKIVSSVVLNIGTLTEPFVQGMLEAGKYANFQSKPVVFDPVGAGATTLRRDTTRRILNSVHVDIIKGNAGEISAIAEILGVKTDSSVIMRGVDSTGDGFMNPADVVKAIAIREHCVVAMTGVVDYVSDGTRTVRIENGHKYQGRITGSGCMVAGAVASFAGVCPKDHFAAAVAGILCMNLAGEHAGKRDDVRGPGTFRAAFIDELANLDETQIYNEFKVTKTE